jgi:dienelactone hydrolase
MLVFLSGLGERGSDPQMLFAGGVAHDLAERPETLKWLPMIMVGPQCPADARYEDARIGKAITGLIDEISKRYPVDAQRRYVTGFSMGGTACWSVARFAKDRMAVYAPVVARIFEPKLLAEALAGTGTTCLVISGEVDIKSEPGSAEMVKALRGQGVDVVYAMIPKGDHYLWPWYYREKRFYEWLLSHRQGQPKPADRMSESAIKDMAKERSNYNDQYLSRLDKELQEFARWWQIDNCSVWGDQGLRREANGKHDVFLTLPYYYEVPCRIQRTETMPKADKVTLHLVVGRHPEGDWRLVVRVNEQEVFASPIDKNTAPDLWKTVDVDLTPWAGQEVRLQLCHCAYNEFKNEQAYWEAIKILPQ